MYKALWLRFVGWFFWAQNLVLIFEYFTIFLFHTKTTVISCVSWPMESVENRQYESICFKSMKYLLIVKRRNNKFSQVLVGNTYLLKFTYTKYRSYFGCLTFWIFEFLNSMVLFWVIFSRCVAFTLSLNKCQTLLFLMISV